MPISAKVTDRISQEIKRYQAILASALQRDVNEANTVVIIADMLADVLGYDKYQHITTEHSIRGTYVDLAVEMDGDLRFLVEAKAIGLELKDGHVKQAVDYGANKGVEWVILTNGAVWRIYKIIFAQPIDKALICELNVISASPKESGVIEFFANLSREGFSKGSMAELAHQKQVTSKFAVASILLSEPVLEELRRELRRLAPGLRLDIEYLKDLMEREVIKRELVEGEEADGVRSTIRRLQKSAAKERERRKVSSNEDEVASIGSMPPPDSVNSSISIAARNSD